MEAAKAAASSATAVAHQVEALSFQAEAAKAILAVTDAAAPDVKMSNAAAKSANKSNYFLSCL